MKLLSILLILALLAFGQNAATPVVTSAASYGYTFLPDAWNPVDFSGAYTFSANVLKVQPIEVKSSHVITKAHFWSITGQAASTLYVCLYDETGTTLLSSGSAASTATGDVVNVTMSTYRAIPGKYKLAVADDNAGVILGAGSLGSVEQTVINLGTNPLFGTAANAISGAACPATLGVITGVAPNTMGGVLLVMLDN